MVSSRRLENTEEFPFYGVRLGSVVKSDGAEHDFSQTILKSDAHITEMTNQLRKEFQITGTSHYVYTETMNQASFSLSGAYGMTGISQLKGAVSGYAGNSYADTKDSVEINYRGQVIAATEVVDFRNLTIADLICSLKDNTQASLMAALDAFLAVRESLSHNQEYDSPLEVLEKNDNIELVKKVSQWINLSNEFIQTNFDGVVVGVVWGGIASAKFVLESNDSSNRWKYGGEGNFSYETIATTFNIAAAYNGGKATDDEDVDVSFTSVAYGGCLVDVVEAWNQKFQEVTFDKLIKERVVETLEQDLDKTVVPQPTEFVQPQPGNGLIDKIGKIQDLEGIAAYAKASAYEKAREKEPSLTVHEFLQKSKEAPVVDGLEEIKESVANNSVNTLQSMAEASYSHNKPTKLGYGQATSDGMFVPLGLWICNWTVLFPWLVTGLSNNIESDAVESIRSKLQLRTMLQDLLTLTRLYRGLAQAKVTFAGKNADYTVHLADTFSGAYEKLLPAVEDNAKDTLAEIASVLEGFTQEEQTIYRTWNDNPCLRNAELGVGILNKENMSVQTVIQIPPANFCICVWKPCDFIPEENNYNYFAKFLKGYPAVAPSGEIVLFISDAKNSGLLSHFIVSDASQAYKFTVDEGGKTLSVKGIFTLYPIRYNAAQGVREWKGASMSTNLGAFIKLHDNLERIDKELADATSWEFTSDFWNEQQGKFLGYPYAPTKLPKSYIGLVKEPANIW